MHREYWNSRSALVVLAVTFAIGCDRGDRAEVEATVERAGEAVGAAIDTVAGRIGGREYTNTELMGLIDAYNDAEIEMGRMAAPKATDAEVRAFAERIVADHRALKVEVGAAARRLNLAPAVPDDDEDLREDHQEAMRELGAQARGREFDERFVEHEITMHRRMLDEVEDALDGERNQEIRELLERARAGLRGHLATAEELEKKFGV